MRVEDLVSIQQAAAILNISRASLYYAIETGKLDTVEIAGRKMLMKKQVETYQPAGYLNRRPSKARPKKAEIEGN